MQQLDFATGSIIIASASVVVGVILAILQLRNQAKTRQAQIVVQLYAQFSDPKFLKNLVYVSGLPEEDKSEEGIESFVMTDEAVVSVLAFFGGVSVLVDRGLIDINLVADLLSTPIVLAWEAVEPHVIARRRILQRDQLWDWVEYLSRRIQMTPRKTTESLLN
ncbi:MAG: DUF4760 domain-containing protein [Candidatus Thorarchaeota archaeon]|jgi:hypothetical protein